jgi:aminopeptidase-like protein
MSPDIKSFLSNLFDKLYPINRTICGEGYDKSLNILKKFVKFKTIKYPTGKKIFDWAVPESWKVLDAYILFKKKKIIDFKNNNLHVINFSSSINKCISLRQLQKNLYSLKKLPKLIPYVTSYYKKNWGFCISHEKRKKLINGNYHIYINAVFSSGSIKNGLAILKGKSKKIVLISSYLCHPSMANNELSGPLVLVQLYKNIQNWNSRNYNYYFLINPETIGSLCFLYSHKNILKKYLHSGLVLTCLGGPKNKLSYKKSRMGFSSLDRLFLYFKNKNFNLIRDFEPHEGSDERQYCSSILNLPVGQVARTVYGTYPEYHTSGDNKKFLNIDNVCKSVLEIEKILKINDYVFPLHRFIQYGELQLGKRNLYPNINSSYSRLMSSDSLKDDKIQLKIISYILSYADGKNDIINIANMTNIDIEIILKYLKICLSNKLIKYPE